MKRYHIYWIGIGRNGTEHYKLALELYLRAIQVVFCNGEPWEDDAAPFYWE